jgi:hypothetical protein
MRHFLLFTALSLFAIGCTVDFIIPNLEPEIIEDDQGYVSVKVTETDSEASVGGCNPDGNYAFGVQGAMLTLEYQEEERPLPVDTDLSGYTDLTGRYLFEGLPPGDYTLDVSSRLGRRSYNIRVDLGEVTRVQVQF